MELYCIGGTTCCGKSTVAELLADRHGLAYYKLDDFLDPYMERMAAAGHELSRVTLGYSMEQMWMRDPADMCRDEIDIYRAMFPHVRQALAEYPADARVLAEGAGLLPAALHDWGLPPARFVCMAPTRRFRLEKYAQRPWIGHYLSGCSDPDAAFANWMERDALFGEAVCAEAEALGSPAIIVDGTRSVDQTARHVEQLFGLA